jgi:hypothetical protein
MWHSETPAEFSQKLHRLELLARIACPQEAQFAALMSRAKDAGMTYREGLGSVICERNGGAD